ncbi:MAG: hypothetical protein LBM96_10200 [Methanobrevibacter sp.]|jgi:hypothetical protein|nr:hypothetical protein [Candidatus Methanoflexus mossambicus]
MVRTSSGEVNIPCKEINCECGFSDCTRGDFVCPQCGAKYKQTSSGFVRMGI